MGHDAHEREAELFARALDLADGEQRAFLERECAGDSALVARILALLRRDRESSAHFDGSAARRMAPSAATRLPERIGPYRILGLLGHGGMGLVYRAEQESPRREVALKVIRAGAARVELVRRFEKEALVLAKLDHEGIARIYDAGVASGASGLEPFVTMELVQGEPLLEYCEHHELPREARVELLARICDAVAHAHDHGVVHRDLKPSNVLVKLDGQPKVLDFGVARIVGEDFAASTHQTSTGELIGTLPYMSPEQLDGIPERVDARSDVYALGVIAYELLVGRRPYDLEGLSVPAAARRIAEHTPTRLGSVDRALRGDLETIVSKALEKEHALRYASAHELAAELRRYLRHEPVHAVRPSNFYYLRRFARRNPALTTSFVVAAVLLVAGTAVSTWQAVVAGRERLRANEEAERSRLAAVKSALAAAQVAAEHDDFTSSARLLESVEPERRGWVWHWLARRNDARIAEIVPPEPPLSARFASGSHEIVSVDSAGSLLWWSAGALAPSARTELGVRLTGPAALDRDARFVAGVHGEPPERIAVWEVASGRRVAEIGGLGVRTETIAVSCGGRYVAIGGKCAPRDKLLLWDTTSGTTVSCLPPNLAASATALDFSSNGERLGCAYNSIRDGPGWCLWCPTDTGAARNSRHLEAVETLAISMAPDGRMVVGLRNKHSFLVPPERGEAPVRVSGDLGSVSAVAFDPAGERVASGTYYGTVRVWAADDQRELAVLTGSREAVRQLDFSSDGSMVMARSLNAISVWHFAADAGALQHSSYVYDVEFVRAGTRLLSLTYGGELCLWDARSLELERKLRLAVSGPTTFALAAARDGELLAIGQTTGVGLLDGDTLEQVRFFELGVPARDVSLSPDGELVCGRAMEMLVVWEVESGAQRFRSGKHSLTPYPDACFSHDGRLLAFADGAGVVRVVDVAAGAELATLAGHGPQVEALAFSPDDTLLASGSDDRSVRLWDTSDWSERAALIGHSDRVYSLAFSPDGKLLASGSNDTTIRLWNVERREELATLAGHQDYVFALAFDPDGSRLISASGDRSVRSWDTWPRTRRWQAAQLAHSEGER